MSYNMYNYIMMHNAVTFTEYVYFNSLKTNDFSKDQWQKTVELTQLSESNWSVMIKD